MPAKSEVRNERINLRASEREAALIKRAALQRHQNLTDFIIESACSRAEQTLADQRHFEISAKQWAQFMAALDRPAQVKPRLKRLFSEKTILEI